MIKSPICELLGITYPVIQGGMAWVADAGLAAAVSNAGGLGIIAAMNLDGVKLEAEIRRARELTDKPFGVNLMLESPYIDEAVKVVCQEKVSVVTTGAGNPDRFLPALKENNIKTVPVVASVALAKMMERSGVDAIIAEGTESGGHVGDTTTMALVPQVVDAVDLPVIAAGGIADGRGMAAAFMLGACGVQMGTRFLAARECSINQNYKDKVVSASDISTIVTGKRDGHPVRVIKNPMTREYYKKEMQGESPENLEKLTVGSLKKAVVDGDTQHGSMMCGQIAGLIKQEETCDEIVTGICSEAEELFKEAQKWVR